MTPEQRKRAIQRLSVRGKLSVNLELRPRVASRTWDGHTETTEWAQVDSPVWVVVLVRPGGPAEVFFRILGSLAWNDVRVENEDLDVALTEALALSEPKFERIDERVFEHRAWLADFRQMAEAIPWELLRVR